MIIPFIAAKIGNAPAIRKKQTSKVINKGRFKTPPPSNPSYQSG